MACPFTILVIMQILSAAMALSVGAGLFLDRADQPELGGEDPLRKYNEEALEIRKKLDAMELQCKVSQLRDKETIDGLNRELRIVSGSLAGNIAQLSAADGSAQQDKKMGVKLKAQLVHVESMCDTQRKHLNVSVAMFKNDQGKAAALRALSAGCGAALLTASSVVSKSPPASFLQGCREEDAAPMLAAGEALQKEASDFSTPFAKQAFSDALRHATTGAAFPALLAAGKAWPSGKKPPSKMKQKAANACKIAKGAVNCNALTSQLDAMATRLSEQKDAAVTNQRKQVQQCDNKLKAVNDRIRSTDAQHARSSSELVRLTGVKAGLAASRASIVQRLERTQRDAKKFAATCTKGSDEYEGELEDILRTRQKVADKAAGQRTVIQDCRVTEWAFQKCTKACKKTENEEAGVMKAERSVMQVPGMMGTDCPELEAELPCNDKPCPVDCRINEWTKWSACSKDCGGGTMKRNRKAITQAKDNGKACPVLEERKACNVGSCDDTCKLKPWTPWSACTRRCRFSKNSAAGRQRRVREVKGNPVKEGGGSPCPPEDDETRFQTRTCNKEICPAGITCDASQDIVFLLDASGAVGEDYEHQVRLVSTIVQESSEKVHFGVVSYGKEVKILSRITGDRNLLGAISAYTPVAGGSRDTAKGAVIGRTLFSDPGVGGGRPKIAVLLLGGDVAGFLNAKKAAEELRSAGVRLVVGLVDDGNQLARDQACSLASQPCEANVEAVPSWEVMAEEPGRFLAGICRDLVYPGPKLSKLDKLTVKKDKKKKKPELGKGMPSNMPNWMKRQLGIA